MPRHPESLFAVNFSVASPAIFFAGLVVACGLIAWMWRRLRGLTGRLRLLVIGLRTCTMLLVLLLAADFSVTYQKANPLHMLVATAPAGDLSAERKAQLTSARARTSATLTRNNVLTFERTAAGGVETDQPQPAGALLITDGGLDPEAARTELAELQSASGGGPVFVLTDLDESAAPRVTVLQAVINGALYRDVPATVSARVHAVGMAGRESTVTVIDRAGVRSTAKVRWTIDDEVRTVEVEVGPKVVGWQDYTVSVEPAVPGRPNDDRQLSAWAEERRWRVLMFEGEPTSESGFIRRSLEQAGSFDVEYFAQVSRDAATGNRPADAANSGKAGGTVTGSPIARLHSILADPVRLAQYDCVIVGPTPSVMLSAAEVERLRQWVDQRGGGLVVLGGNNFTGSIIAPNGRLAALMPAAIDSGSFSSPGAVQGQGRPVEAGDSLSFALVPTTGGANGPLRGFTRARDAGADRRDVLGAALTLGQVGPAGFVLAVAGDAQTSSNDAGRPLIAAQQLGAGRIVLFAPADSFKLKVVSVDQSGVGPFDALWRGLSLWAAQGAGPASVILLSNSSPAVGEKVTIEARFRDATFAPTMIAELSAGWQGLNPESGSAAGPVRPVTILPSGESPGIWRGELIAPEPGRYVLTATATLKSGAQQKLEQRFTVSPAISPEPGVARDTLDRLARETGGRVFALRNLDQLVTQLNAVPRKPATITATWRLRDFWALAFIIPLLLAGEWLILRLKL